MKGFPNQISDVRKLTTALNTLSELVGDNRSTDDASLGEALLRAEVIKPGRSGEDIDSYLARMNSLPPSNQSPRTTARGLKELLVRTRFLVREDDVLSLSDLGNSLLESQTQGDDAFRQVWREAMRGAWAEDNKGISHPYRIMLRLLEARPGTPRALCALALEADDDSDEEFERVLALRDLEDEHVVRDSIGVSKSNWDNAKKILPSIAEQIRDVARSGDGLYYVGTTEYEIGSGIDSSTYTHPPSQLARQASLDTIASWRSEGLSDEVALTDTESLRRGVELRLERSERHNRIVRRVAESVIGLDSLWEDPIDCLAVISDTLLMIEVKTLDGSTTDELHQVRNAASQLLYYEHFAIPEELTQNNPDILKLAVFDRSPSDRHIEWLKSLDITTVWSSEDSFTVDTSAIELIGRYIRLT